METRARLEHGGGAQGSFSERPSAPCSPDWGRTPSQRECPSIAATEGPCDLPLHAGPSHGERLPGGPLCMFYR